MKLKNIQNQCITYDEAVLLYKAGFYEEAIEIGLQEALKLI